MVDDVAQVLLEEARVQGVAHRAEPHDPVPALHPHRRGSAAKEGAAELVHNRVDAIIDICRYSVTGRLAVLLRKIGSLCISSGPIPYILYPEGRPAVHASSACMGPPGSSARWRAVRCTRAQSRVRNFMVLGFRAESRTDLQVSLRVPGERRHDVAPPALVNASLMLEAKKDVIYALELYLSEGARIGILIS